MKWWSRWVTLPHQPACRAGALLVCHDPEIGRLPPCCPERAEFWRLGRVLTRSLLMKLVRLPGIAPGRAPWRRRHSAVKPQPRKLKGPGAFIALPAHAMAEPLGWAPPSTKNKHLLVIYSIPTRGFTAAVSVFRGTPPTKPLNCKIGFWTLGRAQWRPMGRPHRRRTSALPRPFRLVPGDII